MLTALLVIVILVLLIVAHEFGHFIVAKLSGVKVEEFGVGYPPRAVTFGTWRGTEYTLNWLPFGGFVRLFGDVGDDTHGKGSLVDAPRWKQALILVAGVAMNALMAWVLLVLAFRMGVLQPIDAPIPGEASHIIIAQVVQGSPAAAASLKPGDELTDITDAAGDRIIDTFTPDAVVAFVRDHAGEPLLVSYVHEGAAQQTRITPAQGVLPGNAGTPALGVQLALVAARAEGWGASLHDATTETVQAYRSTAVSLWSLVAGAAAGAPDLSEVVGPVGIVSYVGSASQNGAGAVLMLAALISVNLSIINLIPIPALDGGRLAVLALEAVMRRRAPKLAVQLLNTAGISLVVLLMVVVTYHDIARLLA